MRNSQTSLPTRWSGSGYLFSPGLQWKAVSFDCCKEEKLSLRMMVECVGSIMVQTLMVLASCSDCLSHQLLWRGLNHEFVYLFFCGWWLCQPAKALRCNEFWVNENGEILIAANYDYSKELGRAAERLSAPIRARLVVSFLLVLHEQVYNLPSILIYLCETLFV